jgi:hypothetical protein
MWFIAGVLIINAPFVLRHFMIVGPTEETLLIMAAVPLAFISLVIWTKKALG